MQTQLDSCDNLSIELWRIFLAGIRVGDVAWAGGVASQPCSQFIRAITELSWVTINNDTAKVTIKCCDMKGWVASVEAAVADQEHRTHYILSRLPITNLWSRFLTMRMMLQLRRLDDKTPIVNVSFASIDGKIMFDVGSSSYVIAKHAPLVRMTKEKIKTLLRWRQLMHTDVVAIIEVHRG